MAPRACQAEHSVQEYCENLHKQRAAAEVGVLVGKLSVGSRDILLALVRTPQQDTGEEAVTVSAPADGSTSSSKAKKGGSSSAAKAAASVALDARWLATHASEVARLLPGGLAVLGLYLFAPEAAHSAATGQLATALIEAHRAILADTPRAIIAAAAAAATAGAAGKGEGQQEMLLLFVGSDSRKQLLRSCPVTAKGANAAAASAAMSPCELKFGSALSSLVCLTATHAVEADVPATATGLEMRHALQAAADAEAARIVSCVAAVGGRVPDEAVAVNDLVPATASISEAVPVQLYCAPSCSSSSSADSRSSSSRKRSSAAASTSATATSTSTDTCYGRCRLTGQVHGMAIVHKREPAAKALAYLRADLATSLHFRVTLDLNDADLAAEDAAEAAAAAAAVAGAAGAGSAAGAKAGGAVPHDLLLTVNSKRALSWPLTRRVLLPWQGGLMLSSYSASGEPLSGVVQLASQLFGGSIGEAVEVEAPAVAKAAKATSKALGLPPSGPKAAAANGSSSICTNSTVVGAAAAGAVAALAGLMMYMGIGSS